MDKFIMNNLIKAGLDYLINAFPNRSLLKTASPEAKRNVIRRMAFVLINHDRFINDEYREVNGCLKFKRNLHERTQQRTGSQSTCCFAKLQ